MGFYHILHTNSIGHLLRTLRDSLWPPPPPIYILFYFYVGPYIFEKFCSVCRTFNKIWPKNDLYRYSYNVGERAVFAPPPFSHQEVIDAI